VKPDSLDGPSRSGASKTESRPSPSRQHWSLNIRNVWLGIVGAVVCLGLGLAVVGCDSSTASKDKMGADRMGGDRMSGDKMNGDKMNGEAKDTK
jgi:pentapeptide MXKDX repeat protein